MALPISPFISLSLLIHCSIVLSADLQTIVNVEGYGDIQGSVMTATRGKEFVAFRGIRYAEPPVGSHRFQPPRSFIPKNDSAQPVDATKDGDDCLQPNILSSFGGIRGSEDCLFVNVYTPNITSENVKRPVLVFIHGGGFAICSGSSSLHGPRKILNHDVVFVTMNYRLGTFGFFSTNDDAAPGNYGLLDQVEALKWIQKYIHAFGGDPDKVTISGESAGSVSVFYHVLSPLSTGLFHGAIAMSGTPASNWGIHVSLLQKAKKVAKKLHCPHSNTHTMVTCLRYISSDALMSLSTHNQYYISDFGPTVDGTFLPAKALDMLKDGLIANKVPIMAGVTKNEGAMFYLMNFKRVYLNATDEVLLKTVHFSTNREEHTIPTSVVNAVQKLYFDDVDVDDREKIRHRFIDIMSDAIFTSPHYQTVIYLTNAGLQPFVYSYDYKKITGNNSGLLGIPQEFGVGHAEDLYFLIDSEIYFPNVDVDDPVANKFLELWINFVKFHNPTPSDDDDEVKWLPAQNGSIPRYRMAIPATLDYYDFENDKFRKFWMEEFQDLLNESS